ncbi:MAG: winged helix-turn-helix transcriptional regulator [Candidatus Thorarchaeota archaeon]|jgi:predicted transcriptional regulator
MFKDAILENDNRRKIYGEVQKNPGCHLRELERMTSIPVTTLNYHLDYMVKHRLIEKKVDGRYNRYYLIQIEEEDKDALALLRHSGIRKIVLFALSERQVKYQKMIDYFEIPSSTLSYYLKQMEEKMIIKRERVGRETYFFLEDEDRIVRLLLTYKESFLDRLVDKILISLLETRFIRETK